MEEHTFVYRTTGALSFGCQEVQFPHQKEQAMLGDTKVPYGDKRKLPRMGISRRASLLVYQWDYLSGRCARKLGRENE
jgi:hypothetical protein